MRTLEASTSAFQALRSLGTSKPPYFSCNHRREVWPAHPRYGFHWEADRNHVEGQSTLLDQIVAEFLSVRPEGGRFYVTRAGAYIADGGTQFLAFLARGVA
jgi:hypothetical protein